MLKKENGATFLKKLNLPRSLGHLADESFSNHSEIPFMNGMVASQKLFERTSTSNHIEHYMTMNCFRNHVCLCLTLVKCVVLFKIWPT